MSNVLKVVIIGGVAAGPKAAARTRRLLPDAEITILERGSLISYAGCGMPFYIAGQIRDYNQLFMTAYGVVRNENFFQREKGVNVLTRTEAINIDRDNKKVIALNLDTGEQMDVPYDKLVLATGATPFVPPLEGLDLKGVFRLNHPEDLQAIMQNIDNVGEAVVIGAGLIGMESADALRERNIFATVVELRNQILPGVLDHDMASILAMRLEEQGLEFKLDTKVLKLEGDEEGKISAVVTDKGKLDAEMVIIAVGVRPNVELAKRAGLTLGQTGAIEVNEQLQTSDPDIYAAGDCVENLHLISGKKVYIPLASTANRQGRVVGDNIAGLGSKFKGVLGTAVAKVLDWNAGSTGLSEQRAVELGYSVITALNTAHDRTHYHPSHGLLLIKLVADRDSGKVLGAQAIGPGDVSKRIDVYATAMTFGATVDDIADIDLGYAPPFSMPIDPAHHTANIVRNKLGNLVATMTAAEMKEKMDKDEDFVILDVRTAPQFNAKHIDDPRVLLVTLGDMRERIADIPRDKEIVTLCAMGSRAYEAYRILAGAGFNNIKLMEGGLQAWPYDLD